MFHITNENHSALTSKESLTSRHFKSDRNSLLLPYDHVSKLSSHSLFTPMYRSKKSNQHSFSMQCFSSTPNDKNKMSCYSDHVLNHDVISTRSAPTLRKSASASFNTGLMFNLKNTEEIHNPSPNFKEGNDAKNLLETSMSCSSSEGVNENYKLSLSSSSASFFNQDIAGINRSKSSLSDSTQHSSQRNMSIQKSHLSARPQSLYVPFIGRVETRPQPPGKQARDILMALSYPPIHDDEECYQYQMASMMKYKNPHIKKVNLDRPRDILINNRSSRVCEHVTSLNSSPEYYSQNLNFDNADVVTIKASNNYKLRDVGSVQKNGNDFRSIKRPFVSNQKVSLSSVSSDSKINQTPVNGLRNTTNSICDATIVTSESSINENYLLGDVTKYPFISCHSSPIPPLSPLVNAKRSDLSLNDVTQDIDRNILKQNNDSSNVEKYTPPLYSPTHPLNHSENTVISVAHPPVLYPPLNSMQSNCKQKCPLSPMKSRTSERRKSFGSTSISNCSTISQNSHSSNSGENGFYETSKSLSSFSSSSLSSTASSHKYHNNEQSILPSNHKSPSCSSLDSCVSIVPHSPSQVSNKNYSQNDYTKLESIREASPFSNICHN